MHDQDSESHERRVRGHSIRVAILAVLGRDGRELTVSEIRAELPDGTTLGSIIYHLRILEDSGLITAEEGRYRIL